jgi:hypothetical protein
MLLYATDYSIDKKAANLRVLLYNAFQKKENMHVGLASIFK